MRIKMLAGAILAGTLLLAGSLVAFANNAPAVAPKSSSMAPMSAAKPHAATKTIRRGSMMNEINIVSEAATVLQVQPIWILEQMQTGKTVVQIAQDKGITEADFIQKLTDEETQRINDALKSGKIAQNHADALLAGMTDRLKQKVQMKAVDVNDHAAMNMNM